MSLSLQTAVVLMLLMGASALSHPHRHHRKGGFDQHTGLKLRGQHHHGKHHKKAMFLARIKHCMEYDPTTFELGELPDTVAESLADSDVVETPEGVGDCGQVKQVIGKFMKSAKVGQLAGETAVAITAADKAADAATVAKEKAEEAADSAEEVGGGPAEAAAGSADTAASGADEAASAATKASTDAQSQLDTVKEAIKGGNMGGFNVDDDDVVALKAKKKAAIEATKDADKAAAYALEKAENAKKAMLGSIDGALVMLEKAVGKAEEAIAKAKDVMQKSTWAMKEATKVFEAAGEVSSSLTGKIDANEGDQGPVFEALKDGLDKEIEGGENARSSMCAAEGEDCEDGSSMAELDGAISDTEEKMDELNTALKGMKESANPAGLGLVGKDVQAMEKGLEELEKKINVVNMKGETMLKRKDAVSKFAAKASKFDIPWKPPPETPMGAPTGANPKF